MKMDIGHDNGVEIKDGLKVKDLLSGVDFILSVDDERNRVEDYETASDNKFSELVEVECETLLLEEYSEIKKKLISITEDGKVKKLVVRKGRFGDCPIDGSIVQVHYISFIEHDKVPFDSSYTRNFQPEQFKIGVGKVYDGFEIAVKSMKPEELSFFLIDPDLAFKELGVPPRIPPNAHICIEIELINVRNTEEQEDSSNAVYVDKLCFKELYRKAKIFFLKGNYFFNNGDFRNAIASYRKAEAKLLSCRMQNDVEEFRWKKMLLKISLNLCACYNHDSIEKPKLVCVIIREVLDTLHDIASSNAKIFFHLGKAKLKLNDLDEAQINFRKALKLKGNDDSEIIECLNQVEKRKLEDNYLDEVDFQLTFN